MTIERAINAGRRLPLVALVGLFGGLPLFAQNIQVKLVNGHNGHPVKDCLSIWTSPKERGPAAIVRTDKDGVALLRIGTGMPEASSIVAPCKAVPTSAKLISQLGRIGLWSDWAVDCRTRAEIGKSPSETRFYSIEEIRKRGIATSNECGKFKAEPKPGELIFYVRPPHWWEALSR